MYEKNLKKKNMRMKNLFFYHNIFKSYKAHNNYDKKMDYDQWDTEQEYKQKWFNYWILIKWSLYIKSKNKYW